MRSALLPPRWRGLDGALLRLPAAAACSALMAHPEGAALRMAAALSVVAGGVALALPVLERAKRAD